MTFIHTLDEFPDTLAGRIRKMRAHHGMTQSELAEKVRVTKLAIKKIELKGTEPLLFTAAEIAKALGVSIDYLVFGDVA